MTQQEVLHTVLPAAPLMLTCIMNLLISPVCIPQILDVNVKCSFLLTKLVVPHMEKRG